MYVVYVNHPNSYASVHREGCGEIRKRGGVSRRNPPTGYYISGLPTRDQAERRAAEAQTGYTLKFCSKCRA